jgi:hypothetical protein
MADDALLTEEEAPKAPASITKDDFDAFGKTITKTLGDFAKEVTASVAANRQTPTPRTPDPEPTATGDDFLDSLVKDGKGAVAKVVQEVVRDTLGPWVQSQVSSTADSLRETHRTQVDKSYGNGTWDEVLAPEMEKIFSQMDPQTQAIARGNRQTFEAVMKQARGEDNVLEALSERRQKMRDNPPPEMLDSGRTPSKKSEFTPEDKEFMTDYERNRGVKLDRKALLSLMEAKRSSKDGRISINDVGGRNRLNLER